MKISKLWLDKFFDAPLPEVNVLADALTFHAFEIDGIEHLPVGEGGDDVLDVKVTPNRGHDALSHRGIAKELSAILKLPLRQSSLVSNFDISKKTDEVKVTIEDPNLCKRYIAAHIKGVKIGPSPQWLQDLLVSMGQRPINNVVDATNVTMFSIGQPLHAFDAKRLGSLDIGVRLAREGEKLEALDKKVYDLKPSMLVITAADRPVGIAGIKGGEADRVDEETQDIIIESATFDGVTVRKGSQMLKLRTDASARFEQQLSPYLAELGMCAVVELIQEIAGGEVAGFVDAYPQPQKSASITVSVEKINNVLGTQLTVAEVADVFVRLGFSYKEEGGVFEVVVPLERLDLYPPAGGPEDLVEEVGRIVGYDKVAATPLPPFEKEVEMNRNFSAAESARARLVEQGYSEVFTSVFADKGERVVLNKVDGVRPYLRTTLLDSLTEALKKNIPNKELLGLKEIKLFEIGVVWKDGKETTLVGTISEKQKATEQLLEPVDTMPENLPLSTTERYQTFSKYPYIVRDIAIWVPHNTEPVGVQKTIEQEAGDLLVRIDLFDQFEKEGRTSLAFRLVFQSSSRTLVEDEVNKIMAQISTILASAGFEIR